MAEKFAICVAVTAYVIRKYVNRKMRKGDILLEITQTSNVPMGTVQQ